MRYWQQPPVGARCRQSVQNPVQSVGLNPALAWPCLASSARTTRYHRLENPTGVRETGRDGPHGRCGASEHPRPAPRMRYGTCLDLFRRSARKRIHPATPTTRTLEKPQTHQDYFICSSGNPPSENARRERRIYYSTRSNLLRAGDWASRLPAAK
jgi:hypothetical protein